MYIGKKYFSVGPDVRIADNIKAWIVDWLGKNKTLPCGQDLRNLVSEAIARCDPDFIKINKARTFRGGATHYCMANSTRIALGPDANLANAIRNYILDFYVDNKCEWPNGADIRRLARVAEFKLSPSFFPLQISGGRKSDRISISINGVNSGSLGRIGTANAARDYLLRFYESNNYEWPPKSEVPALVKKALEHAKSTLE